MFICGVRISDGSLNSHSQKIPAFKPFLVFHGITFYFGNCEILFMPELTWLQVFEKSPATQNFFREINLQ